MFQSFGGEEEGRAGDAGIAYGGAERRLSAIDAGGVYVSVAGFYVLGIFILSGSEADGCCKGF